MIFWGFVLLIFGGVAALIAFFTNLGDIIDAVGKLGFSAWLERCVTPQYVTAEKIVFLIGVVAVIAAVVLILLGKAKQKKTGEPDKTTQKAGKFLRDAKGEFKKITWPALPDVVRNTIVTVAMCAVVGVVVCLVDLGLAELIKLIFA